MATYFDSDRLKAAFTFQDVYMGLSPFEAPATFSMMAYTELAHGVWYPRGGMYSLIEALVEMARAAGVARVTIVQAYRQLEAEGFIESRVGAGTHVTAGLAAAPAEDQPSPFRPQLTAWGRRAVEVGRSARPADGARPEIDFGLGRSFAELFPYDIWRRLLARYLSTDDAMLSRYGSPAGFFPLRQAVADYLSRARGVRCATEQVVIVSGAQQALDILARLVLSPGDEVVVETPGYRDAFTLFQLHGARLVGLPVDDHGLPVDRIPTDCRARLAFVTPTHQFPKGGTMPLARRLDLLGWAREKGALIVEDDYDGDLRYDCLLYTSPSPRDGLLSRMPSSA